MASVGVPTITTEIEWTPGTWTDVTSYVSGEAGMGGTFGRATPFDDIGAGTWAVTLRNDDGRFMPDNPTSPYYPNIAENVRLRITVTPPSGSAYVRFIGYVTSITPRFPDGDANTGVVEIAAADAMAVANRRDMQTGWIEQAKYIARYNGGWADCFDFSSGSNTVTGTTPTYFTNVGEAGTRSSATGTAQVVPALTLAGQAAVGSADGMMADAALTLTPAGIVGPIVQVVPGGTPEQIEFFVKAPSTGLANGTTGLTIVDFWTSTTELFSLRLKKRGTGVDTPSAGDTGTVDLALYDSGGAFNNWVNGAGVTGTTNLDTDTWFKVAVYTTGTDTLITVNDSVVAIAFAALNFTTVTKAYFGGQVAAGLKAGKQTYCLGMTLAGIDIQGTANGVYAYFAQGTPPQVTAYQRWAELTGYGYGVFPWKKITDLVVTAGSTTVTSVSSPFTSDNVGQGITGLQSYAFPNYSVSLSGIDMACTIASVTNGSTAVLSQTPNSSIAGTRTVVIGPTVLGSDHRGQARVNTAGQTYGQALQTFARSFGGTVWIDAGAPTLIMADQMRSKTQIATIDIEQDALDTDLELTRAVDQVPTRVTVNSPTSSPILIVDTAGEALGYRREMTIDTGCYDPFDAYAVGTYYLAANKALRISRIKVDLSTAAHNLYASILGSLQPGSRLRISGLLTTLFGWSYVDVYVVGWEEHYSPEEATFTFDCIPADVPVNAEFGTAAYSKIKAGGGSQLATAITSSATSLSISPAAVAGSTAFSTSSGDYPMDIDLNGERVTLAGVPGSTTTRTNLCTNPSFETNTTGWSVSGSGSPSIARYGSLASTGSSCLRVTWPSAASADGSVAYTATGLTVGQTYAWSIDAYVPSGAPKLFITGNAGSISTVVADTGSTKNAWVRLSMTAVATLTSHTFSVASTATIPSTCNWYLDGALLERSSSIQSYFDGNTGGSWTGTANASTSTQSAQNFTGCTRGVAPSVARAHSAGEDVDLWRGAQFAF